MLVSLNWLKKYTSIGIPAEKLAKLVGARLVEIEETIDNTHKYDNIYIVKVIECTKIEGSDHLSLCKIDDGGATKNNTRDEKGYLTVVCGAPNVHADMFAIWIAPGAIIPETYGTEEPFTIGARQLKGHLSQGMLAALDELGLGDGHDGIVELATDIAEPGTLFEELFPVNDVVFDIENKSLTHRPDCFGMIGFAREISGILGQKFQEPQYLSQTIDFDNHIEIEIADAKLCPRYSAAILDNFADTPTPALTPGSAFLYTVGMRPISEIVDVTNYLMIDSGQPLHAFDYDKFVAVGGADQPKIIVRAAKEGEKLELLDGKTITLTPNDILITSNNVPVALAGAMGGKSTAIDKTTKKIIIESATFSLYNLRRTSMYHGIFSEAVTRFTKGQPPALTEPVLAEVVHILTEKYHMNLIATADAYPEKVENPTIDISASEINSLLGTDYSEKTIQDTLENVGFSVQGSFSIRAPFWRTDIHIPEDIIEEIGRLLGYDNIPVTLPDRPFIAAEIEPLLATKTRIRNILSSLGANELLTYSFVHGSLLEKVGLDPSNSYKLANSISPDLEYIRQTIMPNLLEKVFLNIKAGHESFDIFEMNKTSERAGGMTDEGVPIERDHLAYVATDDYFHVKYVLNQLARRLGLTFDYLGFESTTISKPFESKRSATIYLGDQTIGTIGEINFNVRKQLKLPETVAGFEINLAEIITQSTVAKPHITEPYKYPSIERDLTIRVKVGTTYQEVFDSIRKAASGDVVIIDLSPISIYQGEDQATKNITFHLSLTHPDKTLASEDANVIMNNITKQLSSSLGAEVI